MANQNDRFIDEVTDELRRDRLFRAMRSYGWIAVVVVVGLVGTAAWFEFSRGQSETASQAFGDALLAASDQPDAAARAAELGKVEASGDRAALRDLLIAAADVDAGNAPAATQRLTEAARTAEASDDTVIQHLALLKSALAGGGAMSPADRDATLSTLSAPGAPFELLALELKAIALVEADRGDDAVALIRQIQQKDGITEPMRRRLGETLITLGEDPEPTEAMAGDVSAPGAAPGAAPTGAAPADAPSADPANAPAATPTGAAPADAPAAATAPAAAPAAATDPAAAPSDAVSSDAVPADAAPSDAVPADGATPAPTPAG